MNTTKQIATEIYNYMVMRLAEGVYINKKTKNEMIKEIMFLIDTD